jgi:large subunit ribosomal protein L10e
MASLRKGKCYREVKRAYTRKSKYKKKGFIKAPIAIKIVKYHMGNPRRTFSKTLKLISTGKYQIRHNALEACRVVMNRGLSRKFGIENYHFHINIFPHHILRENKMLTGAGADRMQSGMKHAFGKAVGSAAQVKKGSTLFTVMVDENTEFVQKLLDSTRHRLPGPVKIINS